MNKYLFIYLNFLFLNVFCQNIEYCRSYTSNFDKNKIIIKDTNKKTNLVDDRNDIKKIDWYDISGGNTKNKIWNNNEVNMLIYKPKQYKNKYTPNTKNKNDIYNNYLSNAVTLRSSFYMHYGSIEMVMKPTIINGFVTSLNTMSNKGDEIDYEFVSNSKLNSNPGNVQANFYKNKKEGKVIYYNKPDISKKFNNYKIDWQPDKIIWYINDEIIAKVFKNSTKNFPTESSYIEIGVWDASSNDGTATWAGGPINWSKYNNLSSSFKSVTFTCNKIYNKVIK